MFHSRECIIFSAKNLSVKPLLHSLEISSKVYSKALSAENLQAGFRETGIYPLNMSAIPSEYMIPSEVFITYSDVNAVESDSGGRGVDS